MIISFGVFPSMLRVFEVPRTKLPHGTLIDNMKSFQELVYADNLDLILVTETWLNSNLSNNELLSKGYNIISRKRSSG